MNSNIELVLKVNELYHDITAHGYDQKHVKVFFDEYRRWRDFGKKYLANSSNKIKVLDVGTGTGFVPRTIAGFLKNSDLFICSDISINILEQCKTKLSKKNFGNEFKFLKLDGHNINLESNELDFVTLNSVLHHIPDFFPLFKEINRLLKLNGFLIIGHEPNRLFVKNMFLFYNFRFISLIFDKERIIPTIFRKLKLKSTAKYFEDKFKKKATLKTDLLNKINQKLLDMNIIKKELTLKEINQMVDFHSPTAAGYRFNRGIDIFNVSKKLLPNFEIEYYETYNHLSKGTNINRFTRLYSSILKRLFPKKGATFFIMLKKVRN